tara:strand:- start:112 stop:882 length:771 start_codon:yes stop_codon:yes gene_type:complete
MSGHGVMHILDSVSGKARPLKLTSDKLGVNDSVAQATLSNIENRADDINDELVSVNSKLDGHETIHSDSLTKLGDIETAIQGTLAVEDTVAAGHLSDIVNAVTATLSVEDSTAQNSLTSIESSLAATLTVEDSTAAGHLSNIESSLAGTITTTSAVSKSATQISNSQAVVSGDFSSSSHNCSSERELVIVGTTTDFSNNIDIWVSNDNSTYYKHGSQSMYPDSSGNFGISLDSPFKYIKVKFNGSGTVNALVMGSN